MYWFLGKNVLVSWEKCTGFLGKMYWFLGKNELVSSEKIIPFFRKQATPLQGNHKTNLDLRHRVMLLL
jgi:hypothetical protein